MNHHRPYSNEPIQQNVHRRWGPDELLFWIFIFVRPDRIILYRHVCEQKKYRFAKYINQVHLEMEYNFQICFWTHKGRGLPLKSLISFPFTVRKMYKIKLYYIAGIIYNNNIKYLDPFDHKIKNWKVFLGWILLFLIIEYFQNNLTCAQFPAILSLRIIIIQSTTNHSYCK